MNHRALFDKFFSDENIYENIDVSDDYAPDEYGNTVITFGFEGQGTKRKKPVMAFAVLVFNKKGRMINMEMATRKRGERHWQIATSDNFINFYLKGFQDK